MSEAENRREAIHRVRASQPYSELWLSILVKDRDTLLTELDWLRKMNQKYMDKILQLEPKAARYKTALKVINDAVKRWYEEGGDE